MFANLKDLEAGDVEHADEVLALRLRVERLVDASDQPGEHPAVQSLRQSRYRVHHLIIRIREQKLARSTNLCTFVRNRTSRRTYCARVIFQNVRTYGTRTLFNVR